MILMQTVQATEVRNNFSATVDTVVREKPIMVKRNRDHLLFLSQNHALALVNQCNFTIIYVPEDDGSITASLESFDLAVNAADADQAITALAKELIDYAQDYFDQFQLYFSSANRKQHFPYVLRVLLSESLDEVKGLIHA